ncbi:MAG: DUF4446 family protein [Patescibacteria group bacterium]|nr:DUF4446 family protein [Patescibacteria group bacterium]
MSVELFYLIGGAVFFVNTVWLFFLTLKYLEIKKKATIIFSGAEPKKLASMIESYFEGIDRVEKNQEKIESILRKTKMLAETGLTKVVLLRYNPFGDVGSNQSFSICLLNKKNDGFVISSIHSREGTRVYSKPVKNGESNYNLSKEEEKAIKLAKEKNTN